MSVSMKGHQEREAALKTNIEGLRELRHVCRNPGHRQGSSEAYLLDEVSRMQDMWQNHDHKPRSFTGVGWGLIWKKAKTAKVG